MPLLYSGVAYFWKHTSLGNVSAILAERDIDDENFRVARRPDRRAPDLDTARHENVRSLLQLISPAQFVMALHDEIHREQLPVVRMAREQDVSAAAADIVEIGRPVFQDDDRQLPIAVSQKLFDRFPASGPSIVPADKVKSVVDLFDSVLKEANPGLIEKCHRVSAVQIMISGDSVDAVFRLQAAGLSFELA